MTSTSEERRDADAVMVSVMLLVGHLCEGSGEVFYRAGDLADRIRKLAKEQGNE